MKKEKRAKGLENIDVNLSQFAEYIGGYCHQESILMANIHYLNSDRLKRELREHSSYKLNVLCCLLVINGTLNITVDYNEYTIEKNSFLFISPLNTITSSELSPEGRYYLLMLKMKYLEDIVPTLDIPLTSSYFIGKTKVEPFIKFSEDEAKVIYDAMHNTYGYLKADRGIFKGGLISKSFSILILELICIFVQHREKEMETIDKTDKEHSLFGSRKQEILRKFLGLIQENGDKEHHPKFYADKLYISVQYLSVILKESTGMNATKWIANSIIIRAKKMLKAPNTTILEVSEMLNFADQSSFGKFFKKHTGISPKKYMDSVKK